MKQREFVKTVLLILGIGLGFLLNGCETTENPMDSSDDGMDIEPTEVLQLVHWQPDQRRGSKRNPRKGWQTVCGMVLRPRREL